MAALNLTPNATVMVVEAGVFLVNFFVVKKLLLEPYLKVHDERTRLTEGSQSAAESLEAQNIAAAEKIQAQLRTVAEETKTARDASLQSAKSQRDQIIQSASSDANSTIEAMRRDLARELEAEKARVPEIVSQLTKEFVAKVVPA